MSTPSPEHTAVLGTPEVLVVDNDPAVLNMLAVVLRHYGLGVTLAASGEEAVEIYKEHHHKFAVVLLDVQMPRIDGPATLELLKDINPRVRCCFMSGGTGGYTETELLGMGAAHFVRKPIGSIEALARLLWDMAS